MSEPPIPLPTAGKRITQRFKNELARPDFGLRVIIVWKAIKASLLVLLAIGAVATIHKDLHAVGLRVIDWLHLDAHGKRVEHLLELLGAMQPKHHIEIGVGATFVAGLLYLEAYGLHKRRVWAEWLTIIVTASLMPLEAYEKKWLALVVNALVVIYIARHRFLFVPGPIGHWLRSKFAKPEGH